MKCGNTMSRIGREPVHIPESVTIDVADNIVSVKGVKGTLEFCIPHGIVVEKEAHVLMVKNVSKSRKTDALHGLTRAIVQNMVTGVSKGWEKALEMSGVGFRATTTGRDLTLTVGYSHPVVITPPDGIEFAVREGKIIVSGIDRQAVGQVAANVRVVRKPEPYKGKGIKYVGEYVRRKAGKTAKAVGAG